MLKSIIKLIRIKQWVKNAFVIAPLLFSLNFMQPFAVINTMLAFVAFCFVASFVYVVNDICDRKKDAVHPVKKKRPIASGKISPRQGVMIALVCLGIAALCLYELSVPKVALVLALYLVMNFLYSVKLKHIALLDVLIIAVGFILRVYAGAYAIGVPVSSFIFMTTLFLSLFLGFTKRKAELSGTGSQTRKVLRVYSEAMINQYIIISAALTIMCYALYTLEPSTIARFETNRLIYSIVFVIYGIFRYIAILDGNENIEDPTENLLKDKGLISACALYVLYVFLLFINLI